MLKAVIMDFDGLIIDTEVVWHEIFVTWFKKHKKYDLSMKEFLKCVGANSEELFRFLETERNMIIDRALFQEETKSLFLDRVNLLPPKDGVVEFIKDSYEAGLKLAVATSAGRAKPVTHLKRFDLIDYFDAIITADDVKRIKPYPDLYLKALTELNVDSKETVILEDSLNGLIAGKRAGVKVIVVPNDVTKYDEFEGYYRKAESLKDININSLMDEF